LNLRAPLAALAVALAAAGGAQALSLDEAMAAALKTNPGFGRVQAQARGADAAMTQARAAALPTVTVAGESGRSDVDLHGFFGFGSGSVRPQQLAVELRQPLFAGGAIVAGMDQARAGRDAARMEVAGARAELRARVAQAYAGVVSARQVVALDEAMLGRMQTWSDQAQLRFKAGEIPRTDVSQAAARLAMARADLARAQGDAAVAEARFTTLVGLPPQGLEPVGALPPVPPDLGAAVAAAERGSPMLLAAEARARAARAAVRGAQAARYPSLALAASQARVRDQFFPGYSNDLTTVSVQGRWELFSGGAVTGRVAEAAAGREAAEAGVEEARGQVRDAVVQAWQDLATARELVQAAEAQQSASEAALDSVGHEVRVGQKPLLDLLDAERDALAARTARVSAEGARVAAAYRLQALTGDETR